MKKLLSLLFLSISTVSVTNVITNNINNQNTMQPTCNILAKKTYPTSNPSIGFDNITIVNNNIYSTITTNDRKIEIYQIINNEARLLTTFALTEALQPASIKTYVIENLIYYEVLMGTNRDNVNFSQYFIFSTRTKITIDLGVYHLAADQAVHIHNNNLAKIYHYQDYLIFVHNLQWYAQSSTTIINLTNYEVTTINSDKGTSMAFSNGLLYYYDNSAKLTATDITNNKNYHLETSLKEDLSAIYATDNLAFVTTIDQEKYQTNINQIKIENNQLTLTKFSVIDYGIFVEQVYANNNSLYFSGTSYEEINDIQSIHIYQWSNNKLTFVTRFNIENAIIASIKPFYAFHDNYFDIGYSFPKSYYNEDNTNEDNTIMIHYNLNNKKETKLLLKNYYLVATNFLENQTLVSIVNFNDDFTKMTSYLSEIQW